MDRQQKGRAAEDVAAAFLESQGVTLLLRNYRRRAGELDIVARQHDTLVIAEVRTRATNEFGGAAASVDAHKQARLLRAATQLLQQRKDLAALRVRFDVMVVHDPSGQCPRIEWIKHAFTAT
jgi:putative endonuclease